MNNYGSWKGSENSQANREENPLQRTYSKFLYQSPLKKEDISSLGSYALNNSLRNNDQTAGDRQMTRSTYSTQGGPANGPISIEHIELREEAINKTSILMLEANREQVKMLKSEIASSAQTIQKLESENRSLTSETTKLREDYIKLKRLSNEQSEQLKSNEAEIGMKSRLVNQQAQELDNTKKYLTNALGLEQGKHEQTRKDLSAATITINKLNVEMSTIKANMKVMAEELRQAKEDGQRKQGVIESLRSDILSLQKRLEGLQSENDALHKFRERVSDYSEIKSENASLKGEIEKLDKEIERLTEGLNELTSENKGLRSVLDGLNNSVDDLTHDKESLINENTKLRQDLMVERSKAKKANDEAELEKERVKVLGDKIKGLESNCASLSSELDDLKLVDKQKDLKVQTLENENEAFANKVRTGEQALVEVNNLLANIFESPDGAIPTDGRQNIDTRLVLNSIVTGITQMDNVNIMLQDTTVPKDKFEDVEAQLNEANERIQTYEGQMDEMKERIEKLEMDVAGLRAEREGLKADLEGEKATTESQGKRIQELNQVIASLRGEQEQDRNEITSLRTQMHSMEVDLKTAGNKIEEYKYREEEQSATIKMLTTRNNEISQAAESLRSSLDQAEKDNNQNKARITNLTNVTKGQDKLIEAQQANLTALKLDKDETIGRLTTENTELKTKMAELEEIIETEKNDRLEKAKSRMSLLNERIIREEDLTNAIQAATPGSAVSTRNTAGTRGSIYFALGEDGNQNSDNIEMGNVTPTLNSEAKSSMAQSAITSPSPMIISNISATMSTEELRGLIGNIDRQHSK